MLLDRKSTDNRRMTLEEFPIPKEIPAMDRIAMQRKYLTAAPRHRYSLSLFSRII